MTDLSDTDRRLLAALRTDARLSITDLAATLGIARATAKARLNALVQDGRIRRFTIETDAEIHGQVKAVSFVQLQGKMSRAVVRSLKKIPEITKMYSTNGAWDLVVDIETDTLARFDAVLREIRDVPGVLNSETCLLLAPA